ncbi:MAG: cysteine desulfurase [Oscillospiraceae bacterium]|jgi:cysteine desulfurase|nr:cysteine desulfurase [Oscillospiraceae bacterium]
MRIYLDNAATTPVRPEAAKAAIDAMTVRYGNPSSSHTMGREATEMLESARAQLAEALGAKPEELHFTSGGTEGINTAIRMGALSMSRRGKHIISSLAEHSATTHSLDELEKQGFSVTRLKPQRDGSVSVEQVEAALRDDTVMVSLMLVNNETGGVTDIAAVSQLLKSKNSPALLHTDAVQGFLKVPFTVKSLGVDLLSLSGHKIHAPKGVGALFIRDGVKIHPLLVGGPHEGNLRAGTQAMPAIMALGVASQLGSRELTESLRHMSQLKAALQSRLTDEIPGLQILSGAAPHIISISLPGHRSETLMNFLEAREIFVSKSSACKKGARSHVLEAIELPPAVIDGALRIGLSHYSTLEEITALIDSLKEAFETLFKKL